MIMAIVGAFNEEKTIGSVVRDLFRHVEEVVVIDDGSRDHTAERAREAGATVLIHMLNRGQGAALETGHAYARSLRPEFVIHFDADGQFDVTDIPIGLQRVQEMGVDVLFGSRFLDKRSEIPFFKRWIILPVARRLNLWFSSIYLSDAHNGFRILNNRALQKIHLSQDGMAHATEILTLVRIHALRYSEFGVKVTYREYGQGIGGGIRVLRDLLIGRFL